MLLNYKQIIMHKCVKPGQPLDNLKKLRQCSDSDSKFLMWLYGEKCTCAVPSNPKEIW